jgi:hypothetical protein
MCTLFLYTTILDIIKKMTKCFKSITLCGSDDDEPCRPFLSAGNVFRDLAAHAMKLSSPPCLSHLETAQKIESGVDALSNVQLRHASVVKIRLCFAVALICRYAKIVEEFDLEETELSSDFIAFTNATTDGLQFLFRFQKPLCVQTTKQVLLANMSVARVKHKRLCSQLSTKNVEKIKSAFETVCKNRRLEATNENSNRLLDHDARLILALVLMQSKCSDGVKLVKHLKKTRFFPSWFFFTCTIFGVILKLSSVDNSCHVQDRVTRLAAQMFRLAVFCSKQQPSFCCNKILEMVACAHLKLLFWLCQLQNSSNVFWNTNP